MGLNLGRARELYEMESLPLNGQHTEWRPKTLHRFSGLENAWDTANDLVTDFRVCARGAGICRIHLFLQEQKCLLVFSLPSPALDSQRLSGVSSDTLHLPCHHHVPCPYVLLRNLSIQPTCPTHTCTSTSSSVLFFYITSKNWPRGTQNKNMWNRTSYT